MILSVFPPMREPSTLSASGSMAARRSGVWLAIILIWVMLRALPNLSYPVGRDQATYFVVAQGLLRGAKLYRDVWDMKPPGIFPVYAGVVKAFGPVMWSVGVVDILRLLLISLCILRFAERYLGRAAAVIAVALNASWHCRAGYVNAAQPETFLVLLVFAAYFAVGRLPTREGDEAREGRWAFWRHCAAGLLLGAAFWLKYNAIAFLPFLLLVPYLDLESLDAEPRRAGLAVPWRVWLKRVAVVLAGFAVALAAVLGYFAREGLWRELVESHFEMLSRYGVSPLGDWREYWLVPISGTVSFLGFLTAFAPLAGFWIAWRARELGHFAPALLGSALGYISVAMQLKFPPYAFEACYPFFAMAWGYLAVKAFEKFRALDPLPPWSLTRVLLWFILANAVGWPLGLEARSLARGYRRATRSTPATLTSTPSNTWTARCG